jgi:tetratricopeptide (TPR) repeat protein
MARQQKKLTKKELKQDPLMEKIAETQAWLAVHGKKFAIGVVSVLVVLAIVAFATSAKKSSNEESLSVLVDLNSELAGADISVIIPRLEEIAEEYKGTIGGAEALFSLGEMELKEKNFERAIEHYEEFIRTYSSEFMLKAASYSGLGAAHEGLEKWVEAAEAYEAIVNVSDAKFARSIVLLKAARCYRLAGETEKAKNIVENLLKGDLKDDIEQKAQLELAKLGLEG